MKIYSSRIQDPLSILRKFEGKDLWVRGVINKENDFYINIHDIVDNWDVYVFVLDTYFIKNIEYSNEVRNMVKNYLLTYKNKNGTLTYYTVNEIELFPQYGIYSTEDLLDMVEE